MKLEDDSHDVVIGAAAVTLLAALIGWAAGLHGLIYVAALVPFGALILFLWTRPSRWARALAIVLMPGILLIYLLPRGTRQVIARGDQRAASSPVQATQISRRNRPDSPD